MHHQHEHLSLRLHRALHSSMGLFEWSVWMHTFARALIAVFIPILLLDIGYGVKDVLLFFLLFTAIDVPLNFLARWLIQKIGARWVIIIGSVALLAYFLTLSLLVHNNWVALLLVVTCAALYDSLYWVAHLFFFMECSTHKKNISRDTSWLFIVQQLAEMLAPAMGAAVLLIFTDDILLYVSAVVVSLSLIPLFRIRGVPDRPRVPIQSWRVFWGRWYSARDYVRVALYGIHMSAEFELYPLFLFILIGSVESVAAVAIIAAIATMTITFFTGRIKRQHRRRTIIIGALIAGTFWLFRGLVTDYIFIYASVFVVGFSSVMMSIPLISTLFEKGEKTDTLSASMWRNIASMGGKALLYGGLLLFTNVFDVSFVIVGGCLFLLAMISRIVSLQPPEIVTQQ